MRSTAMAFTGRGAKTESRRPISTSATATATPSGGYHYHATADYPYIIGAYRGEVDSQCMLERAARPAGGGPQGGSVRRWPSAGPARGPPGKGPPQAQAHREEAQPGGGRRWPVAGRSTLGGDRRSRSRRRPKTADFDRACCAARSSPSETSATARRSYAAERPSRRLGTRGLEPRRPIVVGDTRLATPRPVHCAHRAFRVVRKILAGQFCQAVKATRPTSFGSADI